MNGEAILEITRNERACAGGFADRCIRLLSGPLIQREEFNIALSAANRRSNYSTNPEPQLFCRAIHFIDHPLVLRRISDDAAFADFVLAYFKLWFDERDDSTLLSQQGNDRGQDHGSGDERDIDRRQIELLIEVFRFQITRIDAFAKFNPYSNLDL